MITIIMVHVEDIPEGVMVALDIIENSHVNKLVLCMCKDFICVRLRDANIANLHPKVL